MTLPDASKFGPPARSGNHAVRERGHRFGVLRTLLCAFLVGTIVFCNFSIEPEAVKASSLTRGVNEELVGSPSSRSPATARTEKTATAEQIAMFDVINNHLLGPDAHREATCNVCGCARPKPVDCPRWYEADDVEESSTFMDKNEDEIGNYARQALAHRAKEAARECATADLLSAGGWCLKSAESQHSVQHQNITFDMPQFHVPPSTLIVTELSELIQAEGIKSISDFGAGVGQYKAALLKNHPNLEYRAYDGAGNIVEYTHGFVDFFDLTMPLALPKTDWVMSLEVGEHIPSKWEGMFIRNLHRHNCKGIILSWAVLGQNGHSHINNHSNGYVIKVMEELGYSKDELLSEKLRRPEGNKWWFVKSTMAFRRNQQVC